MHAWVMGILGVPVRRSLHLRTLCDGVVAHRLTTGIVMTAMIYVVGGMRRGQWGLMMTLIRVAAGSVMGVGLHVGGNVLDCGCTKWQETLYSWYALEGIAKFERHRIC
jgi:hypothetical protein